MAEAVAATASIIAVLQVSQAVIATCCQYISSVKNAPREIHRASSEVGSLQVILRDLKLLVEKMPSDADSTLLSTLNAMNAENGPVKASQIALAELKTMLGNPAKLVSLGRAIVWPWKVKAVHDLLDYLQKQKESISLTLATDQTFMIQEIKQEIRELKMSMRQEKVLRWLSDVDPSTNHNLACDKQEPLTGNWLLTSPEFSAYLHNANRQCLWCYGMPGCGKTILFSTVVEYIRALRDSLPTIQYAYFYFDFQDSEKQGAATMVRAILAQIATQNASVLAEVEMLFSKCDQGRMQPQRQELLRIWSMIINGNRKTCVLLDALDECSERENLMKLVLEMFLGCGESARLFATSRKEKEINDVINKITTAAIPLGNSVVDPDIRLFVQNSLASDNRLQKWPDPVKEKIQVTIASKAHGMFRWVECQLRELRRCLNLKSLEAALERLPKDLDETYNRILASIPEDYHDEAISALRCLAFSFRPLSLAELAEAIAITPAGFDTSQRLLDIGDVLEICSGLVTLQDSEEPLGDGDYELLKDREIRLAHFSVKEFLLSGRVQLQDSFRGFSISPIAAHFELFRDCLVYLTSMYFKGGELFLGLELQARAEEFPLLIYAPTCWFAHLRESGDEGRAQDLLLDFLVSHDGQFFAASTQLEWLSFSYRYSKRFPTRLKRMFLEKSKAMRLTEILHFAARNGLNSVLCQIVHSGAEIDGRGISNVPPHSTALAYAASRGNYVGVQKLLELGADINCSFVGHDNPTGAALTESILWEQHDIEKLLLNRGASPTLTKQDDGSASRSALTAASATGYVELIRWLLERFPETGIIREWLFALIQAMRERRVDSLQCLVEHMPVGLSNSDWRIIFKEADRRHFKKALEECLTKAGHQLPVLA